MINCCYRLEQVYHVSYSYRSNKWAKRSVNVPILCGALLANRPLDSSGYRVDQQLTTRGWPNEAAARQASTSVCWASAVESWYG